MTRYAAFLRGINPLNGKSADLTRSFVAAGFTDVRTVLSSGNVTALDAILAHDHYKPFRVSSDAKRV